MPPYHSLVKAQNGTARPNRSRAWIDTKDKKKAEDESSASLLRGWPAD